PVIETVPSDPTAGVVAVQVIEQVTETNVNPAESWSVIETLWIGRPLCWSTDSSIVIVYVMFCPGVGEVSSTALAVCAATGLTISPKQAATNKPSTAIRIPILTTVPPPPLSPGQFGGSLRDLPIRWQRPIRRMRRGLESGAALSVDVDRRADGRPIPQVLRVAEERIEAPVATRTTDRLRRPPPRVVDRVTLVGEVLREE